MPLEDLYQISGKGRDGGIGSDPDGGQEPADQEGWGGYAACDPRDQGGNP